MCRRASRRERLAVVRGRVALFDLFLGLVAGTGAGSRPDRGADDGTRRSGDRATDERPGSTATERTGPGTGLVITFGRLTDDRTADGADGATDDGARRATDGHADGRAAESPGAGADGLIADFLVLGRSAVATALGHQRVIVRMVLQRIVSWSIGASLIRRCPVGCRPT